MDSATYQILSANGGAEAQGTTNSSVSSLEPLPPPLYATDAEQASHWKAQAQLLGKQAGQVEWGKVLLSAAGGALISVIVRALFAPLVEGHVAKVRARRAAKAGGSA